MSRNCIFYRDLKQLIFLLIVNILFLTQPAAFSKNVLKSYPAKIFKKQSDIFISSIERINPVNNITNVLTVRYNVVFSDDVEGVEVEDFILTSTGVTGATITEISGSGNTYKISVNTGTGDGIIHLDLVSNPTITPSVANAPFTGQSYVIDKSIPESPVLSSISNDNGTSNTDFITNDPSLVLYGTGEANSTINIYKGTVSIGLIKTDGEGLWSFDYSNNILEEGVAVFNATITDAAGNISLFSKNFSVFIDLTPPVLPVIKTITTDAGSSNTDKITNDQTLILSGTSEPGTSVILSGTGIEGLVSATSNKDGQWVYDNSSNLLTEGNYIFNVKAVDIAGNSSLTSTDFLVTIDITSPVAPVIFRISNDNGMFSNDGITSDRTLFISGTAEANTTVGVYEENGFIGYVNVNGAGSWTLNYTGTVLSEGNYNFTAVSIDFAGNISLSSPVFKVTIDSTAPFTPVVTGFEEKDGTISSDKITNDSTIIIFGISESNSVVSLFLNGTEKVDSVKTDIEGNWRITYSSSTPIPGNLNFITKATDAAGNTSRESLNFTITFDPVAPVVSISSPVNDKTNISIIPITVNFNEEVKDFSINSFVASGGTIRNFIQRGKSYYFDIIPDREDSVTVKMNAGVIHDLAGNLNKNNAFFYCIYDTVKPKPVIVSEYGKVTRRNPLFTINCSEIIKGFTKEDLIVAGGTIKSFLDIGGEYKVEVLPKDNGELSISIPYGAFTDEAGNLNSEAVPCSVTYDTIAPEITINSVVSSPTNLSPIPLKIITSEWLDTLSIHDLKIINGSLTGISRQGNIFTAYLFPSVKEDTITIEILRNTIQDEAGNFNEKKIIYKIYYDSIPPKASISSIVGTRTNKKLIPVKLNFSEPVIGLKVEDFLIQGGKTSNLIGTGREYTLDIAPTDTGNIILELPAGMVVDKAGNKNIYVPPLLMVYDTTKPGIQFTYEIDSTTGKAPVIITALFSEAIKEFHAADLLVFNGAITNIRAVNGHTKYVIEIAPVSAGVITFQIPSSITTDSAGNDNIASEKLKIDYVPSRPTISITATNNFINQNPFAVSIAFSTDITGFDMSDIKVQGAIKSSLEGQNRSFTLMLVPEKEGLITIDIAPNVVADAYGKGNKEAPSFSITYDITPPAVELIEGKVTGSLIPMEVHFSEKITGFEINDVFVTGGEISNFLGDGSRFTFNIIPHSIDSVTISIYEGVAEDMAGNKNLLSNRLRILLDTIGPECKITTTAEAVTNRDLITYNIVFNKTIPNFTRQSIHIEGGLINNFTGDGKNFKVDVSPSGSQIIELSVPAHVVTDISGNPNKPSNITRNIYDIAKPTILITSPYGNSTYKNIIPLKIVFNEEVINFNKMDITISNGEINNFQGSGKSYSFDIKPFSEGSILVSVPSAVSNDYAGNPNTASEQIIVNYYVCNPAYIITDIEDQKVCEGNSIQFLIEAGGAQVTYQWQVDSGNGFENITDNKFYRYSKSSKLEVNNIPSYFNNYQFQCITTGNCKPSAVSYSATLTVLPKPAIKFSIDNKNITCNSTSFSLNSGTPEHGIYEGQGVEGNFFYPHKAGQGSHIINYTIKDSVGCSNSKSDTIVVSVCTAVEEAKQIGELLVFPNPLSEFLNVSNPFNYFIKLEIWNNVGLKAYENEVSTGNSKFNIGDINPGIYLIRLWSQDQLLKQDKVLKY